MVEHKKTVLAIFAHPDDELGCAGTMANHSDNGDDVHLAFLTKGENISNLDGNEEARVEKRRIHTQKIENLLGVTVHFLDFPDSRIEHNVENGYKVARLIKKIRPNIIITWNQPQSVGAGHPDHKNTSKLVVDAVSYARYRDNGSNLEPYRDFVHLYQYNFSTPEATNTHIIKVDVSKQVNRIREFYKIYEKAYNNPNIYKMHSVVQSYLGMQAGVEYAEEFQLISGYIAPYQQLPSDLPSHMQSKEKNDKTK